MRKIDLKFLMGGFCNPHKDQVLLHAMCNLVGVPFTANTGAESAESISAKAQPLARKVGIGVALTADNGTCAYSLRNLVSSLIARGELTESQLDNEISSLISSVYSTSGYINAMGPFF